MRKGYPREDVLPISVGSWKEKLSGMRIDRASSGAVRGQTQFSADKHIFHVKHTNLSRQQQGMLRDCYNYYKSDSFYFHWIYDRCWYRASSSDSAISNSYDLPIANSKWDFSCVFSLVDLPSVIGAYCVLATLIDSSHTIARLQISSTNDYFETAHMQSDGTIKYATSTTSANKKQIYRIRGVADGSNVNLYVDDTLITSTAYDGTDGAKNNDMKMKVPAGTVRNKIRQVMYRHWNGDMVCSWPCAEGSGTTAQNMSGKNYSDGTITASSITTFHGNMLDTEYQYDAKTVMFRAPPKITPHAYSEYADAEVTLVEV